MPDGATTRRAFLSSLGAVAAGAACGGGDGGGGAGPAAPTTPTPAWASFTDDVNDLLTGAAARSGRIEIPGRPAIEIVGGRYAVREWSPPGFEAPLVNEGGGAADSK